MISKIVSFYDIKNQAPSKYNSTISLSCRLHIRNLIRMYRDFCSKNNYKYQLISFKIVPFRSHTLIPTQFPFLAAFMKVLLGDNVKLPHRIYLDYYDVLKSFCFMWDLIFKVENGCKGRNIGNVVVIRPGGMFSLSQLDQIKGLFRNSNYTKNDGVHNV